MGSLEDDQIISRQNWDEPAGRRSLLQRLSSLAKVNQNDQKTEVKSETQSLSSTDTEDLHVSTNYYSDLFFGTTLDMLRWNRVQLETDVLKEEQKWVRQELDLMSEEIDIIEESDHEIRKLKIRERIKARLDVGSWQIIRKAINIRHDLKTRAGMMKKQVKGKWQKRREYGMSRFFHQSERGMANPEEREVGEPVLD